MVDAEIDHLDELEVGPDAANIAEAERDTAFEKLLKDQNVLKG